MPGLDVPADRRPLALAGRLLLGLIVCLLASCSPTAVEAPPPAPVNTTAAAQNALDALAAAVMKHDRASFDRQISDQDPGFPALADNLFESLSRLPLSRLTLELRPYGRDLSKTRRAMLGSRAFVQQVSVDWQLRGDDGTARHLVWVTFLPAADGTAIVSTSDGSEAPAAQPLWLTGAVATRRGAHTTVLSTSGTPAAAWVRRAEAAAAAVRRRLPGATTTGWNGDLVVELPATRQAFERVLGVTPGSYAQIAAVAWPEGPDAATAAIRIVVNPEQAARLDEQGLAVLLTHEAVHVATRSADSSAPTWLVEGLADYVAYASYPQTAPTAESALLQRVRARKGPTAVPDDAQFSPTAASLSLSYAEAWTLCRFLAETYSPTRLERFYRAVSSGTSTERALRSEFGLSSAQLTARWRAYLEFAARRG